MWCRCFHERRTSMRGVLPAASTLSVYRFFTFAALSAEDEYKKKGEQINRGLDDVLFDSQYTLLVMTNAMTICQKKNTETLVLQLCGCLRSGLNRSRMYWTKLSLSQCTAYGAAAVAVKSPTDTSKCLPLQSLNEKLFHEPYGVD